jgi:heat shock protein HslJ
MGRITTVAIVIAFAALVAACSNNAASASGSAGGAAGLTGKVWQLTAITEKVPAFQGVVPDADQANYTIEFKADGAYTAKADCNNVQGTYTTTPAGGLAIVLGPSTQAACPEGSLSSRYVTDLGNAASYAVTGGQLTITLKDEGTLVFK